jgi:hypothetical protein
MAAHQCPRCELKFSFRTEVETHLATDHRPRNREAETGDPDSTVDPGAGVNPRSGAAPLARRSGTAA